LARYRSSFSAHACRLAPAMRDYATDIIVATNPAYLAEIHANVAELRLDRTVADPSLVIASWGPP